MFDPRQIGSPPGGPPPPAAPGPSMPGPSMPMPPQGAMPPGPPGMPPGAPPGPPGGAPQDPAAMQGLAQAELLSRLEQLGDHDLAAIQHGISPQAVAVLARVVPELGVVLELIEEGVRAAQGDTGGDSYAGDEGDYASDDDSKPDDTDAEGVDPEEPDADDEEEAPLRPARPKTALGRM